MIALFAVSAQLRTMTASIYNEVVENDDRYYLPPAKWMYAFSLGFNEVAADLVWIKTLVYFGDLTLTKWKNAKETDNFSANYMNVAASLDRKFHSVYLLGSELTLVQTGQATPKSASMAISLLERGLAEFPDDGEIAFNLGFMHYYEMTPFLPKEKNDPKRRYHKEKGAKLMRQATLMDGGPPYAALLVGTLLKREGLDELIVEHLKAMLLKETDEEIKQMLEERLRAALGEAAERDIEMSRNLLAEWRSELPYVSYDFFLLLRSEESIIEVLDPLSWSNRLLGFEDEGSDLSSKTWQ
ncbi:MAG: hypothetical protein GY847_41435 [Proteobacteria bacterium]|nr:hypothetical protein [Pseudomonadota bacterium]